MTNQVQNAVDYSLYLVTDSTQSILGGRGLIEVVKAAVDGGKGSLQFQFLLRSVFVPLDLIVVFGIVYSQTRHIALLVSPTHSDTAIQESPLFSCAKRPPKQQI